MLKGLEAVEIKLSECRNIIDFRIDANTYKKEYILTDKLIRSKSYTTIEKLSSSVQNFGAYSLCNFINFTEEGTPFLMTANVKHNYLDWNIEKYVDVESHNLLYKSHCKKGQILVTMAGEYLGRVAVYDRDFICSSNQAIAKVTVNIGVYPYIISTFLNSRFGQNQINRFRTLTGQPNINMSLIKGLLIPSFSSKISLIIEQIVKGSELKRRYSFETYTQAETLLLQEIGLQNFEPSKESVNIKSFKESFGTTKRLDAEYYQKKYENYLELISSYSNGFEKLINVCNLKDYNFNPSDNKIYKYIELSNIGKAGEVNGCTEEMGSELPSRARRLVNTDDVIISSIEGSLQSCAVIPKEYNNALCSTGFYVIKSDKLNSQTLLVLFKSEPMQAIMKQNCSGTILTGMNKDEFSKIPIPLIANNKQLQIAELAVESFKLKAESERLLEVAKKAVEMAIEENEEKAMEFIKSNIYN